MTLPPIMREALQPLAPPPVSWEHPIWYGKWWIYPNDFTAHPEAWRVAWSFVHDDFDGAEDAGDHRCGYAATVEACRAEIDALEAE